VTPAGHAIWFCNTCAVQNCLVRNRREHVIDCGDYVPISGSPIANCGCDADDEDLQMLPPKMFHDHDGPAKACQAAAVYNMAPRTMSRVVANNVSPGLAAWTAQAKSDPTGIGGTNPAGQYGSAPRTVHSVSELLGDEVEGEEVDEDAEEETANLVDEYFNPDTHKIDVSRTPQDANLSPRVKKLQKTQSAFGDVDLMGSSGNW
jgi:hypothetical protein